MGFRSQILGLVRIWPDATGSDSDNGRMTSSYVLKPLPSADADRLRAKGGRRMIVDSKPGFPCRECQQDAEMGEPMLLVSYDPFEGDSAYRGASPVFIHEESCGGPVGEPAITSQHTDRQLSVRAFDDEFMMIDASLVDGGRLEAEIERHFDNDEASVLHVHNSPRGCWSVTVTRRLTPPRPSI